MGCECVWCAAAGFEGRVAEWDQPRIRAAASPANCQRILSAHFAGCFSKKHQYDGGGKSRRAHDLASGVRGKSPFSMTTFGRVLAENGSMLGGQLLIGWRLTQVFDLLTERRLAPSPMVQADAPKTESSHAKVLTFRRPCRARIGDAYCVLKVTGSGPNRIFCVNQEMGNDLHAAKRFEDRAIDQV